MSNDLTKNAIEDAVAELRNLDIASWGVTVQSAADEARKALEGVLDELRRGEAPHGRGSVRADRGQALLNFIEQWQNAQLEVVQSERAVLRVLSKMWPAVRS